MTRFTLRRTALPGLLVALAALAACNTVDGVGKDVQAGGKAISEGAATVQEDLKQ